MSEVYFSLELYAFVFSTGIYYWLLLRLLNKRETTPIVFFKGALYALLITLFGWAVGSVLIEGRALPASQTVLSLLSPHLIFTLFALSGVALVFLFRKYKSDLTFNSKGRRLALYSASLAFAFGIIATIYSSFLN